MKTLFVCASVLTLVTASIPAQANPGFVSMDPYFAGAPEEEQGKQEEQGKEEEKNQEENKQEEQNQEENKQEDVQDEQGRGQRGFVAGEESSVEAQRWGRGRFVCYSRNIRGRTFQAQGFQRFNVQRRAIQNCRARSGFTLGRTCTQAGCRRF